MLEQMGIAAKQASYKLAQLSSREKIACWKNRR
ncbi:gamma-glutamyl phosphate reductase [Escherichia coli]